MAKIKNFYHKRLNFVKLGVSLEAGEVREVNQELARKLLRSPWIKEEVPIVKQKIPRVKQKIPRVKQKIPRKRSRAILKKKKKHE